WSAKNHELPAVPAPPHVRGEAGPDRSGRGHPPGRVPELPRVSPAVAPGRGERAPAAAAAVAEEGAFPGAHPRPARANPGPRRADAAPCQGAARAPPDD